MVVNLTQPQELHLNVNEIFGPTVQGEGPTAGQICGFLRLAGCNLSCSWCDTPYSWDWERHDKAVESHAMPVSEVAQQVNELGVPRLVISGGEPMLQQRGLMELGPMLRQMHIEIETNGTRAPRPGMLEIVERFNVSPKLDHAGDPEQLRLVPEALASFSRLASLGRATFKFVAATEGDLDEVQQLVTQYEIPQRAVWIMPEGYTRQTHLDHLTQLADAIIARHWNLAARLHVITWEQIRKR